MLKYIKKFNFSILVFIAISLFFSLQLSKMEVVKMHSLEQNNFFLSDSIIFHLKSDKIYGNDFLKLINSEDNVMVQKKYIEKNGFTGEAVYCSTTLKDYPNILEGRYFNKADFLNNSPVAVIGKNLKNRILTENDENFLIVDNIKYHVIGIMGGDDSLFNDKFIINLSSYLLNLNNVIDVNDFYQIQYINKNTNTKFTQLEEKFKLLDSNSMLIEDNSREIKNPIMDYIKNVYIYVLAILGIFLLNIIFITSYYISKSEKEIGVMKALGLTNKSIIKKIVYQYELVSLMSFLLGIIIHYIIYRFIYINTAYYRINVINIIIILMVSIVIGFISSIWPTVRLLRIEPNEIMKR